MERGLPELPAVLTPMVMQPAACFIMSTKDSQLLTVAGPVRTTIFPRNCGPAGFGASTRSCGSEN